MKLHPPIRPLSLPTSRRLGAALRPLLGSIAALCALSASPAIAGEPLFGLDAAGTGIVQFDSTTPGVVTNRAITGLVGFDTVLAIDFRPATGVLFGTSTFNRLYTLSFNGATVQATQVGVDGAFATAGQKGFDFNPVPDRIRLVAQNDANLRLNPNDGTLTATDGTLAYAVGDPNAAQNPQVVGSAYTNNFNGATTTTLHGIDSTLNILFIQNPPNSGTLNTVGALGIDASEFLEFDISGLSATAFLADFALGLYTVNLDTGAVTAVGAVGNPVFGLAALPLVPLYWDTDGVTAGLGGTGNWGAVANTNTNWTFNPAGTGPNFTWPNTALSDAIFAGTAGTVTLVDPLQVRNVTFNVTGYTITGAPAFTLATGGSFTVTNALDTADIEVALTGAGAFVKNGPGTLELSGLLPNTYTGGSFINDGVVLLNRGGSDSTLIGPVIVIGDGIGAANSAETRNLQGFEIADNANVTVNADGLLNLNGFFDDFTSLSVNGGNVTLNDPVGTAGLRLFGPGVVLTMNGGTVAGPGTVILGGDVVASGGAVITASLDLQGATRTFTVNDSSAITDLLVSGVILDSLGGGAGLTKEGAGLMLLTGVSTYVGPTTINGGSFIVDGSIASANTFVNPNGLLGGSGTVFGNVFNRGVVSPGNSTGTLTIGGNFTQFSEGTLRIEIVSKSDFDRLLVGGAASIDGTLQVLNIGGFKPKRGDTFKFLTANGGVSGEFDQIIQDGFNTLVRFEVERDGNSLLLVARLGSFVDSLPGLTPNQRAVAKSLDKAVGDGDADKLIDFLSTRDLDELYEDLDRIAPDELAAIFETSISLATVQSVNLQRRTDDLRSGASGFSASGLAMQGTGPGYSGPVGFRTGAAGPTGREFRDGKESKAVSDPVPDKRWGAFLTGVGEWVDVSGDGNARGYDITTGGFTLGVDYKVTPNFALGLMAGYAGTGADLTGDGRVFVNGGKLGLYATYFTGGFYVDTAVSGGYNSYDTKRTALQGTARGDTDGGELNVLFGTGYDFQIGGLKIGPTATFQYTYVGLDGFTERGSLAPLTFGDQNAESVRSAFGFKASYDWRIGGMILRPEVRAAWQHEFGDESYDLSARFASNNANQFNVTGPKIGRDSLLVGAGFALQFNERTATYLYYDGQLARDRYESHSVSGGIRVAF